MDRDNHSRSASPRDPPRPMHRPPSPPPPAFDNRGYQHDEDLNHNDSFSSTNAHKKSYDQPNGTTPEAVNLELINLTPKNGKKKEESEQNTNPYDEYFVPVNEHRKYMRGEKLYVTADKRGEKGGCRRPLCWTLFVLAAAAIIALIVLAATGVLFTAAPTLLDNYNASVSSARAFGGLGIDSQHDQDHSQHDTSDFRIDQEMGPQDTSFPEQTPKEPDQVTPTPEPEPEPTTEKEAHKTGNDNTTVSNAHESDDSNDMEMYVPRTIEGELRIDNEEFIPPFEDPDSEEFHHFSHSFSTELSKVVFDKNIHKEDYNIEVAVIKLRPGSLIVTYRIHWKPKSNAEGAEEVLTPEKLNKALKNYFEYNSRMLGLYHIAEDKITAGWVLDLCQINKNDCEYECEFDETSLDFVCSCPRGKILDMENLKKCVAYLESDDTTSTPENTKQKESRVLDTNYNETMSTHVLEKDNSSNNFDWKSQEQSLETTTLNNHDVYYSHIFDNLEVSRNTEVTDEPAAEPQPEPEPHPTAEPEPKPTLLNFDSISQPEPSIEVKSSDESKTQQQTQPMAVPTAEPAPELDSTTQAYPPQHTSMEEVENMQDSRQEQGPEMIPQTEPTTILEPEKQHIKLFESETTTEFISPDSVPSNDDDSSLEHLTTNANEFKKETAKVTATRTFPFTESTKAPAKTTSEIFSIYEREKTDEINSNKNKKYSTADPIFAFLENVNDNSFESSEITTKAVTTTETPLTTTTTIITTTTAPITTTKTMEPDEDISFDLLTREEPSSSKSLDQRTTKTIEEQPTTKTMEVQPTTKTIEVQTTTKTTEQPTSPSVIMIKSNLEQKTLGKISIDSNAEMQPTTTLKNYVTQSYDDFIKSLGSTMDETFTDNKSEMEVQLTPIEPKTIVHDLNEKNTDIKPNPSIVDFLENKTKIDVMTTTTEKKTYEDGADVNFDTINMFYNRSSKSIIKDDAIVPNSIIETTTEDKTITVSDWIDDNFTEITYNKMMGIRDETTETSLKLDDVKEFSKDDIEPDYLNMPTKATEPDMPLYGMVNDYDADDSRVKRVNLESRNDSNILAENNIEINLKKQHALMKPEISLNQPEPLNTAQPELETTSNPDTVINIQSSTILANEPNNLTTEPVNIDIAKKISPEMFNISEPDYLKVITIPEVIMTTIKPEKIDVNPSTSSVDSEEFTAVTKILNAMKTEEESTTTLKKLPETATVSAYIYKAADLNIDPITKKESETVENQEPTPVWEIDTLNATKSANTSIEIPILSENFNTNVNLSNNAIRQSKDNGESKSDTQNRTMQTNNLKVTIYEVPRNDSFPTSKPTHSGEYEDHETEMNPFLPEVENNKILVKKLQEGHDLEPASINETQNENIEEQLTNSSTSVIAASNEISFTTPDPNISLEETPDSQIFENNNAKKNLSLSQEGPDIYENQRDDEVKQEYKSSDKLNRPSFLSDTDDLDVSLQTTVATVENSSRSKVQDKESDYLSVVPIVEKKEENNSFLKNYKSDRLSELNDIHDSPKKSDRRTLNVNKLDSVISNEA